MCPGIILPKNAFANDNVAAGLQQAMVEEDDEVFGGKIQDLVRWRGQIAAPIDAR
jgi:hypothetical protein